MKIKIMVVFGTRPEAIKMCPIIKELEKYPNLIETIVCVTGQHSDMLNQVLDCFGVVPNINLKIMKEKQDLFDITISILSKLKNIYADCKPDMVLVHGDTTTTYAASIAAFYSGIKIGHVEAGLRTFNLKSPFPEEFNRTSVSIISDLNFAPTKLAMENLIREGKSKDKIFVTGNTAIDALNFTVNSNNGCLDILDWVGDDTLILLTAHRRENLGDKMSSMFKGIKQIVDEYINVKVVYPVHPNPLVKETANAIFKDSDRVKLIPPLDVIQFHNLMNSSYIILTDSGGIQEEAPSLGKPVLVMRDTTERPEGVEAGTLKLVGTSSKSIYLALKELLDDKNEYAKMAKANNPYGDGHASERIVQTILCNLKK